MGAGDRIRAVIDQPSRQIALAIGDATRILIAPVHENQNERRLLSRFRQLRRHARAIERALVVRIVEGNHRRFRARSGRTATRPRS